MIDQFKLIYYYYYEFYYYYRCPQCALGCARVCMGAPRVCAGVRGYVCVCVCARVCKGVRGYAQGCAVWAGEHKWALVCAGVCRCV